MGSDRISSLPSAISGYILSFLTTKEAVSTSILSTKWKHMWHSIVKLDLNDDNSSCPLNFTTLMYRLFLRRKGSPLNDLCLSCRKEYHPLHVNEWIDAALCCNVTRIDISLSLDNRSSFLYNGLFSNTTLTVLKLRAPFVMNIPAYVCLPCLKVVDLSFVKFLDDDSLTRFICGCPLLEKLTLSRCIGEDLHVINIASPLLTRLVLEDLPVSGTDNFQSTIKCEIVIDTPSLMYLEMKNYFAEGYVILDLENVIEAHVAISSYYDDLKSEYADITDLLNGISNVQSLHVSLFDIVYDWTEDYMELPEFSKLTYLELIVDVESDFLLEMLQSSPCLETLVYKEEYKSNSSMEWKNESRTFDCCSFSTSLKVIEIKVMHGLKCADNMILFFSKNVKALEKLIVKSKSCDDELQDDLAMVTCILKNKDHKIEKFTMDNNASPYLRKWVFDYTI